MLEYLAHATADYLTENYTQIWHEKDFKYNAPHHFEVYKVLEDGSIPEDLLPLVKVDFQEGPIKECGINGMANEDAIAMVLFRLESFQNSDYACDENQYAIESLRETLKWLNYRTAKRAARGVEGTSEI